MPVPYARNGKRIEWDQGLVRFIASDVRREGQRTHATVTIAEEGRILEEDDIQPGHREDRVRLANAAHGALNGAKALYPKEQMQHDLLLFCRDLWEEHVGAIEAVRLRGTGAQPVACIVDGLVVEAGGTIGYGQPGSAKSWTAMLMAVSVDAGVQAMWNVRQAPALYINLERSAQSMAQRLGCVNRALGLPEDRDLLFINKRGQSLADVIEGAARTVEREGVGFVVLDSLSRAGAGDLKENQPANRAMDMLNGLGVAWWAIAHSGWEDKHEYGSMMFRAAADVTVRVETEEVRGENKAGVALKVEKANDLAWVAQPVWAYEFADDGSGIATVRRAAGFEFATLHAATVGLSLKGRIIEHLRDVGEDDATSIASGTGVVRTTVSDMLRNDPSFKYVRKDGKRSLYALSSLETNVTERHVFTPNRHNVTSHPKDVTTREGSIESVTSESPF